MPESAGSPLPLVHSGGSIAVVAEIPTGTVTFLFSDIEGSTHWWEEVPGPMRQAMERHDAILRCAITAQAGYVFSTGGDGFAASFTRAGSACEAAVQAQTALAAESWPEPVSLRVRMALHTGEVAGRGGDYFGCAYSLSAPARHAPDSPSLLRTPLP